MALPTLGLSLERLHAQPRTPASTSTLPVLQEGMEHLMRDDREKASRPPSPPSPGGPLAPSDFQPPPRLRPPPPPPPTRRSACAERSVPKPSPHTVARIFEMLLQPDRDLFGEIAKELLPPGAMARRVYEVGPTDGAELIPFDIFGWRQLMHVFTKLDRTVLESERIVAPADAGRTDALWPADDEPGSAGDQTSVAVADREVLNEAECNFRSMILRELEKETVRYRGSRG